MRSVNAFHSPSQSVEMRNITTYIYIFFFSAVSRRQSFKSAERFMELKLCWKCLCGEKLRSQSITFNVFANFKMFYLNMEEVAQSPRLTFQQKDSRLQVQEPF